MKEAQRCNELAFLVQGKTLATGTPNTIKKALGNVALYTIELEYTPLTQKYLSSIDGLLLINQFGDELRITINEECNIEAVQNILDNKLGATSKLQESSLNLEDVFIVLTQEKAL